jgi:hypothetical protein
MAHVEIVRNEIADASLAARIAREIADAAAAAGPAERLACAILDEGLHLEIEVDLPGWVERVQVPYPARPGDVARAMERLLRDVGLIEDRTSHPATLSREF